MKSFTSGRAHSKIERSNPPFSGRVPPPQIWKFWPEFPQLYPWPQTIPVSTGSHSLIKQAEPHHPHKAKMHPEAKITTSRLCSEIHENHKLNWWQSKNLTLTWHWGGVSTKRPMTQRCITRNVSSAKTYGMARLVCPALLHKNYLGVFRRTLQLKYSQLFSSSHCFDRRVKRWVSVWSGLRHLYKVQSPQQSQPPLAPYHYEAFWQYLHDPCKWNQQDFLRAFQLCLLEGESEVPSTVQHYC